jgi:hypothetical protein
MLQAKTQRLLRLEGHTHSRRHDIAQRRYREDPSPSAPKKRKKIPPKSQIQKLYSKTFSSSSSSYFIPFLSCCMFLFILRYIILITDEKGQNMKMIDEVKILKAPPQKKIEVEKLKLQFNRY